MTMLLPREELQDLEKQYPEIDDPVFFEIARAISRHTMTDVPAQWTLFKSIEYIIKHKIEGDIVECGVWNGGSMVLAAYALIYFGDTTRKLYLYDTFEGMPKPDATLDKDYHGNSALLAYFAIQNEGKKMGFGGTEDAVRRNVFSTGYPQEKFVFVKGMVEDTMESTLPDKISLLRLDTDFYASTYHELVHGYPRLSSGGIIIVDDYGYFLGSRKATDQYIEEHNLRLMLTRINHSVHLAVKP